jgi:predicted DNA-binding protein with PD1-like motif
VVTSSNYDISNSRTSGSAVYHCIRLHRGDDLLLSIKELAKKENIQAAVVLSAVGCVLKGRVRNAGATAILDIPQHCEIVSLNGTVSALRTHLHIALSKSDLSTVGGHLTEGCIVDTTCELVLMEIPGICYDKEFDKETGYDELIFKTVKK